MKALRHPAILGLILALVTVALNAAPAAGESRCPDCNAVVEAGSRFCTSCGRRLEASEDTAASLDPSSLRRSVFRLRVANELPYMDGPTLLGTAFAVAPGILMTDVKLVASPEAMEVRDAAGHRLEIAVFGVDRWVGVGFLRVPESENIVPLMPGPEESNLFGTSIHVASFSQAGGTRADIRLVTGVVSGVHRIESGLRPYEDYMQIDAVTPTGSLGAPALDGNGQVVGMAARGVFIPMGRRGMRISGINFVLPVAEPLRSLEAIRAGSPLARAWLGVALDEEKEAEDQGLPVLYVYPDTGAHEAGFAPGDRLLEIDGMAVKTESVPSLQRRIASRPPGERIVVRLLRKGKPIKLSVVASVRPHLPRLEPLDAIEWLLGFRLESVDGVNWRIREVAEWRRKAEANRWGGYDFRPFDRLKLVNGKKIKKRGDLEAAVDRSYGDEQLRLSLTVRDRKTPMSSDGHTRRGLVYLDVSHLVTL